LVVMERNLAGLGGIVAGIGGSFVGLGGSLAGLGRCLGGLEVFGWVRNEFG